ncbi:MAG: hypothetical protein HPY79_09480 [Bacteroidales bacterium]|nr:hypothetical protein [Bacteroidales bacterium]
MTYLKNEILLFVGIFFILLSACTNKTEQAIQYNDKIITQQQQIVNLFNKLDSSFADTINQSFQKLYQNLKTEIEQQIKAIDTFPDFDSKSDFKQAYKKLLLVYNDVVNNDYAKMIKLYTLPDSLYTETIKSEFLQTNKLANDKLQQAINDFINFQKSFASTYQFSLQDQQP